MKAKMSKKSTITVTVMACLLAVAVATTIVLAAFNANKTATTTVQFASGVKIQVNGAYEVDPEYAADSPSTAATLFWGYSANSQNYTHTTSDKASTDVVFLPISFTNGESASDTNTSDAYLIAQVSITPASSRITKTVNEVSDSAVGWVAVGDTGWYAYVKANTTTVANAAALSTSNLQTLAVGSTANFVTAAQIALDNELAGQSFTANVRVFAVNAGASDAVSTLQNTITPSP